MKIYPLIAAGVVALTPMVAAAEDTLNTEITGAPVKASLSIDEKAMNACFQQFIAEILPGVEAQIRTVDASNGPDVFGESHNFRQRMKIEMDATSAVDGSLLATARCTVSRNAKVASLKTHVKDAEALANITVKDLRFVASVR